MTPIRSNLSAETSPTTLIGRSFAAVGEFDALDTGSSDLTLAVGSWRKNGVAGSPAVFSIPYPLSPIPSPLSCGYSLVPVPRSINHTQVPNSATVASAMIANEMPTFTSDWPRKP